MQLTLACSGTITQNVDGFATCSTGWSSQLAHVPFELSQIDPSVATAMFGAGFALFITPWATAFGAKQLLKLLK